MSYPESIHHVFVYGTLKRGEERAGMWPVTPQSVQTAYTRGALYDLGPYPGMLPGQDRVLGELWELRPDDVPVTLAVLDAIEGYRTAASLGYKTLHDAGQADTPPAWDGPFLTSRHPPAGEPPTRHTDPGEGRLGPDANLFVRHVVTCWTLDGTSYRAHAYFLAHPQLRAGGRRVPSDGSGFCRWQGRRP